MLSTVVCGLGAMPVTAQASDTIATVAGNGAEGFSGDGGPATQAAFAGPNGVASTADGGFLVADVDNHRIRRVSPTGQITTVAGTGTAGFSGDGGPATRAQLAFPNHVVPTADGGFLIVDSGNFRIRHVSANGVIRTVAGSGGAGGFGGDGGPATRALIGVSEAVSPTVDGGFLIADESNQRIRRVTPTGVISTVAGTGAQGFAGDGGPATRASLNNPSGVAAMADGGFLIADKTNGRIRHVSPTGVITTAAGNGVGADGSLGFGGGDGGPATAAPLYFPWRVAIASDGGFLIADTYDQRIRRVSAAGVIQTVAGNSTIMEGAGAFSGGFAGDGGPATEALLNNPIDVSPTADGGFLIADSWNQRIRRVTPSSPPVQAQSVVASRTAGAAAPRRAAAAARPAVTVRAARTERLRAVLRRGFRLRVVCRRACRVRGRISLNVGTGRRVRAVTLATFTHRLRAGRRATITARLPTRSRRRLARLRRATVTVRIRATDNAGKTTRRAVRITVRR